MSFVDKRVQKKGKKTTSRRYNLLPLLRSRPGGLAGSWPCRTYPAAKVLHFLLLTNFFLKNSKKRLVLGFSLRPFRLPVHILKIDCKAFTSKYCGLENLASL